MPNMKHVVLLLSLLVFTRVRFSASVERMPLQSSFFHKMRLPVHYNKYWDNDYLPQSPPGIGVDSDESGDHGVDEEEPCAAKIREELLGIKKEVQSLTALVDALRTKVDPDFKMSPTTKESLVSSLNVKSKCPHGFEFLEQSRSCYKVIFERHNWNSATEQCKHLHPNSHLVSITTSQESDALTRYFKRILSGSSARRKCGRHGWGYGETSLWTSGQRVNVSDCSSNFAWNAKVGRTVPFNFTNWNGGEPNCYQGDEICMEIIPRHRSTWNDVACRIASCPVCEYNPQ